MTYYHGTMGSSKTLKLMVDEYLRRVKMHHDTLIIKPFTDKKSGENISTRVFGGEERAAIVMPKEAEATEFVMAHTAQNIGDRALTLYLDEVNFFTEEQILSLRKNVVDENIADVKMFGLITDAFGRLFPGSHAALIYADTLVHFDNICDNDGCDRVAMRNARISGGEIVRFGPQEAIDGIDASYMSLCHKDYVAGIVRPPAISTTALLGAAMYNRANGAGVIPQI